MSAVLTAKGLTAGHGTHVLFSDLDLTVAPGEVTGLVGVNGAGKSTLLRLLAGLDGGAFEGGALAQGSVTLNPPTATVGYLPQEPDRRADENVAAFLARRTGVAQAQLDLDEATEALAAGAAGADDAYATALDRWLNLGGADLEERAAKVITTLGLRVELDRPMTGLSGGQAARANLASLLLSRYDVFLLDEPTNDLDIGGLEILEDFVRKLRAATVLVSHDRAFLERTVDRVLELDLAQQKTRLFGGGYAGYLEERETARRHARENYERYAETRAELEARRRTQIGWADKGVREAKSKAAGQRQAPGPGAGRPVGEAGGQGQGDRADDRPTRGGRGAAQGVAAADGDSRRAALRLGGGRHARGGRRPRRVPARPGQPADRLGRPGHGDGAERRGQVDAHRRAARPGSADVGAGRAGQRHHDRRGGPGPQPVPRRAAAARRVRGPGPRPGPGRGAGPCWRSTGSGRTTSPARRAACPPASAPAPGWPCSKPAASTCSSSTSRPTTSTCRPSSSSSRPSTAIPARSCW